MPVRSIYAHPNGRDYVAQAEDGSWWQWPAEKDGWRLRAGIVPPSELELQLTLDALPPALVDLARRASGVDDDA